MHFSIFAENKAETWKLSNNFFFRQFGLASNYGY